MFFYDGNDDKAILKNINLEIPRASRLESQWKSTLITVFLKPTKGKILVDDIGILMRTKIVGKRISH